MNDFFDAWLRRSGAMRLSYGYTTSPGSSGGTQVHLTIRQEGTAYSVPLQVALISERGRYIKTVDLQGSQQTVTLEVPGAVSSVDIDPEEQWLKYTPRLLSPDALAVQAAPSVRR